MSTLSKEQIKAIVKGNNFQSVTDVTTILRIFLKTLYKRLWKLNLKISLVMLRMNGVKKILTTVEMVIHKDFKK